MTGLSDSNEDLKDEPKLLCIADFTLVSPVTELTTFSDNSVCKKFIKSELLFVIFVKSVTKLLATPCAERLFNNASAKLVFVPTERF